MERPREAGEWSRLCRARGIFAPQVLHARFVRHEFSRHIHDEYVIGLIESGIQRFDLGRTTLQTPAGELSPVRMTLG